MTKKLTPTKRELEAAEKRLMEILLAKDADLNSEAVMNMAKEAVQLLPQGSTLRQDLEKELTKKT